MSVRFYFIRSIYAVQLAELFLVNAIASIIAIRVFLHITAYLQFGGGGLHIAHMLWGGLLMLIAMLLFSFYLDKPSKYLAAILGGLGFGTFIDELGKFITHDNNYFFKPTFALIYIIFIFMFLLFRYILQHRKLSKIEYLNNALSLIQEGSLGELDKNEKKLLKSYLKLSDLKPNVYQSLNYLANKITVKKVQKDNIYIVLRTYFKNIYLKTINHKYFLLLFSLFFTVRALHTIMAVIYLLFFSGLKANQLFYINIFNINIYDINNFNFFDWGTIIFSGISNIFIVIGLWEMRKSLLKAFLWFRRSILVSILFYQVFAFYHHQLLALVGVFIDILIYYALNYLIAQRSKRQIR